MTFERLTGRTHFCSMDGVNTPIYISSEANPNKGFSPVFDKLYYPPVNTLIVQRSLNPGSPPYNSMTNFFGSAFTVSVTGYYTIRFKITYHVNGSLSPVTQGGRDNILVNIYQSLPSFSGVSLGMASFFPISMPTSGNSYNQIATEMVLLETGKSYSCSWQVNNYSGTLNLGGPSSQIDVSVFNVGGV